MPCFSGTTSLLTSDCLTPLRHLNPNLKTHLYAWTFSYFIIILLLWAFYLLLLSHWWLGLSLTEFIKPSRWACVALLHPSNPLFIRALVFKLCRYLSICPSKSLYSVTLPFPALYFHTVPLCWTTARPETLSILLATVIPDVLALNVSSRSVPYLWRCFSLLFFSIACIIGSTPQIKCRMWHVKDVQLQLICSPCPCTEYNETIQ